MDARHQRSAAGRPRGVPLLRRRCRMVERPGEFPVSVGAPRRKRTCRTVLPEGQLAAGPSDGSFRCLEILTRRQWLGVILAGGAALGLELLTGLKSAKGAPMEKHRTDWMSRGD